MSGMVLTLRHPFRIKWDPPTFQATFPKCTPRCLRLNSGSIFLINLNLPHIFPQFPGLMYLYSSTSVKMYPSAFTSGVQTNRTHPLL